MLCCTKPTSSNDGLMDDDLGISKILTSIDQLRVKANGKDQDLSFLTDLLHSKEFRSLVKVHEMVTTPERVEPTPFHNNISSILNEVFSVVLSHSSILEIEELLQILSGPHFKALAKAHDQVAAKDFLPRLPEIPFEVDEDDDVAVKVVRLVKGPNEPLGATIHRNDETGLISIARIMHGGAADRCGLIHSGDIVNEVNGVAVTGKAPEEVVQLLMSGTGPVTLTLVPGDEDLDKYKDTQMRVRAHFAYDPGDDRSIPCHEVGLAFKRGDILEIVSQDDPLWWQARRMTDRCTSNPRAGLIPGLQLLERKEVAKIAEGKNNTENKNHRGFLRFSPKASGKSKCVTKISKKHSAENDEVEGLPTFYEEVEKYLPGPVKRPIVLIGSPGVGRSEMKRHLITSDPTHFCETVPFTSRPKRPNEVDGVEYYFLSRKEMETDIQNKRFVEYGEYKGNLYGTCLAQIKSVINDGRVCVICPRPQALKTLRCADLKPFVVFIKSPCTLEKLMETRSVAGKQSPSVSSDQLSSRQFTEEELSEIHNNSVKLDSVYGSYFDHVIVNDSLEEAAEELCRIARAAESEPSWVPVSWIR